MDRLTAKPIQVRMLDDWDIADLNIHEKDGKNFVPS